MHAPDAHFAMVFFTCDINLVIALYFYTCAIRLLFKIESTQYNTRNIFSAKTAQKCNNIIYNSAIAFHSREHLQYMDLYGYTYTRHHSCYSFCFYIVFFVTGFTRKNIFPTKYLLVFYGILNFDEQS